MYVHTTSSGVLAPQQPLSSRAHFGRAKHTAPTIDKTLARRLAQLQALPRRDRDALLRTLDAFLAKSSSRAA